MIGYGVSLRTHSCNTLQHLGLSGERVLILCHLQRGERQRGESQKKHPVRLTIRILRIVYPCFIYEHLGILATKTSETVIIKLEPLRWGQVCSYGSNIIQMARCAAKNKLTCPVHRFHCYLFFVILSKHSQNTAFTPSIPDLVPYLLICSQLPYSSISPLKLLLYLSHAIHIMIPLAALQFTQQALKQTMKLESSHWIFLSHFTSAQWTNVDCRAGA